MGYIKLKKASGDFDVMPDANVATVKLDTAGAKLGKIRANYISDLANEYTIIPAGWDVADTSTHFVQADVTKINEALLNAKGIAGNPVPELSQVVGEVTYAADA